MTTRKAKPAPATETPVGTYTIQVLHEDHLRVDLYDFCIPTRTGEVEPGWGSGRLTCAQAFALAKELTAAAVRAQTKRKK